MQKFNVNIWKNYYNRINSIGAIVKKNMHDKRDNGVCDLAKYEIERLMANADQIMGECTAYLNECGMVSQIPLWHYDLKDETTWRSSRSFKHWELVK